MSALFLLFCTVLSRRNQGFQLELSFPRLVCRFKFGKSSSYLETRVTYITYENEKHKCHLSNRKVSICLDFSRHKFIAMWKIRYHVPRINTISFFILFQYAALEARITTQAQQAEFVDFFLQRGMRIYVLLALVPALLGF